MIELEPPQLIFHRYSKYVPPKNQLLKWIGNKQKFATEITKYFPVEFNKYFEPFLGSGAVLATVKPKYGVGSDTFKPLMEIWNKLKDNPNELTVWYKEWRDKLNYETKEEVYRSVKNSYNRN